MWAPPALLIVHESQFLHSFTHFVIFKLFLLGFRCYILKFDKKNDKPILPTYFSIS